MRLARAIIGLTALNTAIGAGYRQPGSASCPLKSPQEPPLEKTCSTPNSPDRTPPPSGPRRHLRRRGAVSAPDEGAPVTRAHLPDPSRQRHGRGSERGEQSRSTRSTTSDIDKVPNKPVAASALRPGCRSREAGPSPSVHVRDREHPGLPGDRWARRCSGSCRTTFACRIQPPVDEAGGIQATTHRDPSQASLPQAGGRST